VTAAARNLELKAVDPDPVATRAAAIELGAEDGGVLVQRDTYFHAVQGRLKLREIEGAVAELISYARADVRGPKVSHYRVVPVLDPPALAAALADALGVRVVVDKRRELLLWHGVRIHLDDVGGLGCFVELEAVATDADGLRGREQDVAALRTALGIADERLVGQGYADLLERITVRR
jgi:adenylate cyclase class IV